MKKTTYWKDVWRTFVASKGRMLSIALLMALGSFALIGLKVTSPNMKKTGEHFFKTHQTADLSLISTYSINQTDQDLLNSIKKEECRHRVWLFQRCCHQGDEYGISYFL